MAELFGRVDGVLARAAAARCTCSTSSAASWAATGSSAATCRSPPASALACRLPRHRRRRRVCMFGDGASNQGTFGETMNLAALWRLPVVFMVTNNQFGMGTALERHSAVTDLQRKGEGFGVPGHALRRHGRASTPTTSIARGAAQRARGAPAACSSRRSPTASAATRWPTPRSTAPRRRSRSGASATRSRTFADRLDRGGRARPTTRRDAARRGGDRRRVDEAVAFADAVAVPDARVALRRRLRARRPGAAAGTRSTSARPACTAARTSASAAEAAALAERRRLRRGGRRRPRARRDARRRATAATPREEDGD